MLLEPLFFFFFLGVYTQKDGNAMKFPANLITIVPKHK